MHCVVFAVAKQDWTSKQVHLPKKWAISSPKNMKEPWLLPRHGLPWLEQNRFLKTKSSIKFECLTKRQIHTTRRAERRRRKNLCDFDLDLGILTHWRPWSCAFQHFRAKFSTFDWPRWILRLCCWKVVPRATRKHQKNLGSSRRIAHTFDRKNIQLRMLDLWPRSRRLFYDSTVEVAFF